MKALQRIVVLLGVLSVARGASAQALCESSDWGMVEGGASWPLTSECADPADSGVVRLCSAEAICWEGAVSGTDGCLTLDGSEIFTLTNGLVVTGDVTAAVLRPGTQSNPADSGVIRLDNAESICWEASPAGTDQCLSVDATEVLTYNGAVTATGTVTGGTITDGTLTCTAGTCTGGVSITSTTLTDGTATMTGGALSGVTTITATGNASIAGQVYDPALTTYTPAGTTQTIDWDSGNVQKLDLEDATGDVTLTLSNPHVGRYILEIQQDGAGGAHNVVWPGTVTWANATAPTISAGNDAVDVVECIYTTAYRCAIQQDFQ